MIKGLTILEDIPLDINEFLETLSKRFKNLFAVEVWFLISSIFSTVFGVILISNWYPTWSKHFLPPFLLFSFAAATALAQVVFTVFAFFMASATIDYHRYLERHYPNAEPELIELLSKLIKSMYVELLIRVFLGPLGICVKMKTRNLYKQLHIRAGTLVVEGE